MDGTILIADDDRTIRTVLTQALTRAGCKVHATASLTTLMRWVEEGRGDLVISDVIMPEGNGLDQLPHIAELRPGLPVIVISAQNTITTAIRAEEAAAYDYLPKPFDLPDLMKRVARGLAAPRDTTPATPATGTQSQTDLPLVGRSDAMQGIYRLVTRLRNAPTPVLIAGASGTGKSLIAKAIHDFSENRDAAFISATPEDFAAPDTLDARVSAARGGTLVIEDIGALDAEGQARALRLLDLPGDTAPRILATARPELDEQVAAGSFRDDLFYRLASARIDVPPLRDRPDDIALLAQHFLDRAAQDMDAAPRSLTQPALALLREQGWPGNLRQLDNLMRHLMLIGTEPRISPTELKSHLSPAMARAALGPARSNPGETLTQSVERHIKRHFDMHEGELPPPGLYARVLRQIEQPLIEIALDATGGNQSQCADLLGINRNTLRKKITDLEIEVTRRRKLM